ncbi:hypothetical protein [Sphingobacterium sp. JUb56]|jgi:hypothetical protein|uniref:hypothetical protein n=1 Tax=Sphingobacterium sp. JUb56 TaxID=2587145 RepID=UPI00161AD956|nr:hypothetical protein [Sphingobacterium sp. JUb56]MBB2952003.1 hypothetical protein [Sphingobacterium sp. JUb56]
MKIIKIEPQPTVAGLISEMKIGETLHFDISHTRAVQEAASRKMKSASPNFKFPTVVNREMGIIQVTKESL